MKNITLSLDDDMAAWLRLQAAKRDTSISKLVGDLVYEHMRHGREYDEALRRFLSYEPVHFEWVGGRPPTREEIHDRALDRELSERFRRIEEKDK